MDVSLTAHQFALLSLFFQSIACVIALVFLYLSLARPIGILWQITGLTLAIVLVWYTILTPGGIGALLFLSCGVIFEGVQYGIMCWGIKPEIVCKYRMSWLCRIPAKHLGHLRDSMEIREEPA